MSVFHRIFIFAILCLSLSSVTHAQDVKQGFADIAAPLMPAIVNISTSKTVQNTGFPPGFEPFGDFFEDFLGPRNRNNGAPREHKVTSLGSGFVIDKEGYIVTNHHVIQGAEEITIKFSNGDEYDAKIIGHDPKTDLALLKIEPDGDLPFVIFGDSQQSRIGEWVLAIGNPFGLGGSLSAGIISAINRDIHAGPYDSFIQTDAAINRGNSGGPLFNLDGEVIGINSAIISPTGGSVGIGFAIPSDLAQQVIGQLREFGETRRSWIGVTIQPVSKELAESLNLDKPQGALISNLAPGGPAEKAQLKPGDVILKFDGHDIAEMRDLPRIVAETPIEKTVKVVVKRNTRTKTLTITTQRMEETNIASSQAPIVGSKDTDAFTFSGMTLRDLDQATREKMGYKDDVTGAYVAAVEPDSLAAKGRIREGNVILEVAYKKINSAQEAIGVLEQVRDSDKKFALILLLSPAGQRFIPLQIERE